VRVQVILKQLIEKFIDGEYKKRAKENKLPDITQNEKE